MTKESPSESPKIETIAQNLVYKLESIGKKHQQDQDFVNSIVMGGRRFKKIRQGKSPSGFRKGNFRKAWQEFGTAWTLRWNSNGNKSDFSLFAREKTERSN